MTTEHGHILVVTDETVSSYLDAAHLAAATTLTVDDAYPFSEGGGSLALDNGEGTSETVVYTAIDLDLDTITLATGLVNAYAEGTRVWPVPEQVQRMAQVALDDSELPPILARIPFSMQPMVPLGIREIGVDDQEVTVELIRGEWVVTDILREVPAVDGGYVELVADQVTADNIAAGSITAEKLAGELILASLIKTAETGLRVEIDSNGIRLVDASDAIVVNIPTGAAQSATFRGGVVAEDLTVEDTATFVGATTFDTGATASLANAQAPPTAAPTVTQGIDTLNFDTTRSSTNFPRGLWWWEDDTSYVYLEGGIGTSKWRNVNADGTLIATANLDFPTVNYEALSIVYHEENDEWVGTARRTTDNSFRFMTWADSAGVPGTRLLNLDLGLANPTARPMLTKVNGSTTIHLVYGKSTGGIVYKTYTVASGGASPVETSSTVNDSPGADYTGGIAAIYVGTADFGATRIVLRGMVDDGGTGTLHSDYSVFNTSLAAQTTQYWPAHGASARGITYQTSTGLFHELAQTTKLIHIFAPWTEAGVENEYQVAYTWYDSAGTTHESAMSPRAEISHQGRRYVTVSWPTIPSGGADDPNSVRILMIDSDTDPGSAFSSYERQPGSGGNFTGTSTTLSAYDTSGASPTQDTAFAAGTPATLSASVSGLLLAGDGKLVLPSFATGSAPSSAESALYYDTTDDVVKVRNADIYVPVNGFIGAKALKGANQTITAANTDVITWSSTSYDVGTFFDNANDRFTVPTGYAGYYRVLVVLEYAAYAANHGGRRVVQLRNNTTVVATTSNTTHDRQTTDIVDTILLLAVGDDLDVRVNAVTVNTVVNGTGAEIDTYFILEYLGPGAAN